MLSHQVDSHEDSQATDICQWSNEGAVSGTVADNAEQIKQQIQAQANVVRRSFESSCRRKATSAATKAAAASMASANMRKRQKISSLFPSTYPSSDALPQPQQLPGRVANRFFSPIASVTRGNQPRVGDLRRIHSHMSSAPLITCKSEAGLTDPLCSMNSTAHSSQMTPLHCHPHKASLSNNDVICGMSSSTNHIIGNLRYSVMLDLHQHAFKKATSNVEREIVARSIVHTVRQSVPSGRFLTLNDDSGLWVDMGDDGATVNTLKELAMRSTSALTQIRLPSPIRIGKRRCGLPRAA